MYLVIWMCLQVTDKTEKCRIWNLEVAPITMRGCIEFAEMYMGAWDDGSWRVRHWRCSTTPVPKGEWDGAQVE